MKKRAAVIASLISFLPLRQPLLIVTGAVLTSSEVMFAIPEIVEARDFNFYLERGVKKGEEGDYHGAVSDLTRVIEITPSFEIAKVIAAYYNRGFAKYKLGDYDEAISDYTRAIEIDPSFKGPHTLASYKQRGILKSELGDYDGAISDFSRAIEIDPSFASAYFYRGTAKFAIKEWSRGCADLRKAASLGDELASDILNNQFMKFFNTCQG